MDQHYILCGLGKVGLRVLEHLRAIGARVVVVNNHPVTGATLVGVPVIIGDCRSEEVLERAGVKGARGVLILTSDDLTNLSTTLIVRHLNPTVRVVLRLFNQNLIARLGSAVLNVYALSTSALAGPLLALIARTGQALTSFHLDDEDRAEVAEFTVAEGSPLAGRDLSEVAGAHEAVVVAHRPAGGAFRFLRDVTGATRLRAGDQVVICGSPHLLAPLLAHGGNESLPELLWANFVRRFSRVAFRGLAMMDTSVKVGATTLVIAIVVSVLTFRLFTTDVREGKPEGARPGLVDAFYWTVSLMATGADMRGNEFQPGAWEKVFLSGVRLVGMVLTAAFTAIFTNYLIRANLGGALAVRRIPDGGHVIVCGLGNVGFRAVEELHRHGEPVVVIERRPENTFIPTTRRLGIPVIVGDATVLEVLRQARAPTARAVIAASSNDLINLEISLLVRELAPRQRVVIRLTEPALAQKLREAANVRLALSVPELSAPAFVARLLGEHARGLFFVAGRLLIVYDLQIPTESPLIGRPVAELAAELCLTPVALYGGNGARRPLTPEATFAANDRLTVILAPADLQRLLLREATCPPAAAPAPPVAAD
jgi:Trk K+ transport system NAD-binding subunit